MNSVGDWMSTWRRDPLGIITWANPIQGQGHDWTDSWEHTISTCVLHLVATAADSVVSELDPKCEIFYEQ